MTLQVEIEMICETMDVVSSFVYLGGCLIRLNKIKTLGAKTKTCNKKQVYTSEKRRGRPSGGTRGEW